MILFLLIICFYTPILHKTAEKPQLYDVPLKIVLKAQWYPCTFLATAFFSFILKKFWNQIWIPHAITYKAIISRWRYQAICGHIQRFFKLIHYFFIFNQIFPAKKTQYSIVLRKIYLILNGYLCYWWISSNELDIDGGLQILTTFFSTAILLISRCLLAYLKAICLYRLDCGKVCFSSGTE